VRQRSSELPLPSLRAGSPNSHKLLWFPVRQGAEQHRVNNTEDGGVGPNAQRQRQDRNQGKERVLDKQARAMATILPDRFEPSAAAHVVTLFFNPRQIAETSFSAPSRFIRRHAAPDVLLHAHVHVELQLVCDLPVDRFGAPQPPNPAEKVLQPHNSYAPLSGAQNFADGEREALPVLLFNVQLFAAGGCEFVKAGAAVVFRYAPLRLDPLFLLKTVEGGIERPFFNFEHLLGHLHDALADTIAVHRP